MDVFERYGLKRIINVSGTETVRGASPVCREVLEAVNSLVPKSVEIAELQSVASAVIAKAYGTEAGFVTGCSSAGIAVAIAACMAGRSLPRAEQLPDTAGMRDQVVMQRGHNVTWGGHVAQTVALTGARLVEVGAATECGAYQIRHVLGEQTACGLFIVSHHTVQTGLVDLRTFCEVCHAAGVPVVVDGAAEPHFRSFVEAGADIVITSAQKVFSAFTAGVVAGRSDLVRACMYQEKGIGRPMKAAKESIIAAIAGIERWMVLGPDKWGSDFSARLERGREILAQVGGLAVSLESDWTSGAFHRLRLDVDPRKANLTAYELAQNLAAETPSIAVRSLYADQGFLQLDIRRADMKTVEWICGRIAEIVGAARGPAGPAVPPNPADQAMANLEKWPLPVTLAE